MWYIYTMEYYLVTKRDGILIRAITQMRPENMLSEISQTKTNSAWFYFCEVPGIAKFIKKVE